MSQTLTLTKGTFIEVADARGHFIGQIEDYTREGTGTGGEAWLKVKLVFNVSSAESLDRLESYSSSELSNAGILRSFASSGEAQERIESIQNYANQATAGVEPSQPDQNVRTPTEIGGRIEPLEQAGTRPQEMTPLLSDLDRIVREVFDAAVGQTVAPQSARNPAPRSTREAIQLAREEQGQIRTQPVRLTGETSIDGQDPAVDAAVEAAPERRPMVIRRTQPRSINADALTVVRHKLPFNSGDIKTLIKVAEENPQLVFDAIDAIVNESGHQLFRYLPKQLQREFIQMKLDRVSNIAEIEAVSKEIYHFRKKDQASQEALVMYIGGKFWYFLENASNIEDYPGYSIIEINQEYLDDFIITNYEMNAPERLAQRDAAIHEILSFADDAFDLDIDEPRTKFKQPRLYDGTPITTHDIGEQWEKAIVLAYFEGVDIPWEKLDANTFSNVTALQITAETRNDQQLKDSLGMTDPNSTNSTNSPNSSATSEVTEIGTDG